MISAPIEYVRGAGHEIPWPELRFPGYEEDEGESHICRGID
ncbi:hypothetical protein [Kitasatospora sp. NPDC101183]